MDSSSASDAAFFCDRFRKKDVTRNLLVFISLSDGNKGIGEASASLAWPEDNEEAMGRTIRRIIPSLEGKPISSYQKLIRTIWEIGHDHPTAAAALECALVDAFTRHQKISLWKFLGGKTRTIRTSLTISAWNPQKTARAARHAAANHFRTLKVKITGSNEAQDLQRLLVVHKTAPRAALIVDANQGLTPAGAIHFISLCRHKKVPIILMEQPVVRDDWEGLKKVEVDGKIPVAADESARSPQEAEALIRQKIVSVINIKLAKSGLTGALRIIQKARNSKVKLMIGCMAESAIGLSPSVHLACGTGAFDFVDLDSHLLVASPQAGSGFTSEGDLLRVSPKYPGTGAVFLS